MDGSIGTTYPGFCFESAGTYGAHLQYVHDGVGTADHVLLHLEQVVHVLQYGRSGGVIVGTKRVRVHMEGAQ